MFSVLFRRTICFLTNRSFFKSKICFEMQPIQIHRERSSAHFATFVFCTGHITVHVQKDVLEKRFPIFADS